MLTMKQHPGFTSVRAIANTTIFIPHFYPDVVLPGHNRKNLIKQRKNWTSG
jgi:hypothetical protein